MKIDRWVPGSWNESEKPGKRDGRGEECVILRKKKTNTTLREGGERRWNGDAEGGGRGDETQRNATVARDV